jgi:hypothetical protein
VTLDCPNVGKLAGFYAEITGGEVTVLLDHWAMVTCPDGSVICFQVSPAYSPPTWPDETSSAQMHLDFDVDDLDATEARALPASAVRYDFQPNDHCRVYADPAGTPFACPPSRFFRRATTLRACQGSTVRARPICR